MTDESHIKLGLRVKKSREHPMGWQYVSTVPPDTACVIALSGSDADNSRKANGFAKMVAEVIKDKTLPIYAVEYDLGGRVSIADRMALLNYCSQGSPNAPELRWRREEYSYIPQYIKELYEMTLAPRLRDENGARVSVAKAAQRLNMFFFTNHCQGSTVSFQLERLFNEDMERLGWSQNIRNYLLKQIHNVDVAPVIPLGLTKTTTFKFVSLADTKVTEVKTPLTRYALNRKNEHSRFLEGISGNETERRARNRPFMMDFSYFRPKENETIFAVNSFYPLSVIKDKEFDGIEHTFDTVASKEDCIERTNDDKTSEIIYRSKQGDLLSQTFRETLNWLAEHAKKNSQSFAELPDIFKEKRFSRLLAFASAGRYKVITNEISLIKSCRQR